MDKGQLKKVKIAAALFLTAIGIVSFFFSMGCGLVTGSLPLICKLVKIPFYIFYFPFLIIASNELFDTSFGLVISFTLILAWSYLLVNLVYCLLSFFSKRKR